MADLSAITDEELEKRIAEKQKPKNLSSITDEELNRRIQAKISGQSLGGEVLSGIGEGISSAFETVDRYTGAPARAFVSEAIRTKPEFGKDKPSLAGNIVSGFKAAGEAFGAPAGTGPSGKDIATARFGADDEKRVVMPKYKFAGELSEPERARLKSEGKYDPGTGRYLVGEQESMTRAEAAGLGIEMALDPINAISLGAGAIARATGKALKGVNRALFGVKLRPNAKEIEAATAAIGGKATPGQLIDSPLVSKLEGVQAQSEGQLGGSLLRRQLEKNKAAADEVSQNIIADRSFKTGSQTGAEFEQKFMDELGKKLGPAEDIYGAWEGAFKQTGLPVSTKKIANNLKNMAEEVKFSPEGLSAIDSANQNLAKIKSIDDLKAYRSTIGKDLANPALNGNARYVLSQMYKDLSSARSESLQALAKLPESKEFGEEALRQLKEADRFYAEASGAVENALLNKGRPSKFGPKRTAENFFDQTTEIQRINKVLKTGDPKKIAKLAEDFPQAFDVLRQGKIEEFVQKSEVNGVIDIGKLTRAIDKMPEESKSIIFGPKSAEKIRALKTFYEARPMDVNPSKTALARQLIDMFNPYTQAMAVGRSAAHRFLTAPELGRDMFSRLGASELTTPLTATGVIAPKIVLPERGKLNLPKERNP